MAKKKEVIKVNLGVDKDVKPLFESKENEGVSLVSPELEKKVAEIKKDEVTILPQEEKTIATKMVKIKARENHKCYIGGEWYFLIKGKQYNVPENVRNILLGADMLSPL